MLFNILTYTVFNKMDPWNFLL